MRVYGAAMKCEGAGCVSTSVREITYIDTFDDDAPASGWFCPEHVEILRQRDLAALGLQYLRATEEANAVLAAFQDDRLLVAGPAGDPHLAALDRFLQLHRRIASALDATGRPEAKALVAEADEQMVERVERILTLAARLRDVQAGGEEQR